MRLANSGSLLLLFGWLTGAVAADPLPPQFTLGRYVPSDVWMYVHGADNPERHWIEQRWSEIFRSLKESGVDQDVKNLVFAFVEDEQRVALQSRIDKTFGLLGRVRWLDLMQREFVIAERVSPNGSVYDYLLLARGTPDSAGPNLAGLRDIVKEIAALSPQLAITESKSHDFDVTALGYRDGASEKVVSFASLWRKDDVIALALTPPGAEGQRLNMADDVLRLMSGDKDRQALVDSPRFREAFAQVKPPSDTVSYFDMRLLLGGMRGMFGSLLKKVAEDDPEERLGLTMMVKLTETADIIDYVIVSEATKGRRAFSDECTRVQSGKERTAAAKVFLDRRPFERFDEYIPAEATGFSLSAGVDLEQVYNLILNFIEQNVPDGKAIIEQHWKPFLASTGLDLQRDLFSWWSGESISITMPPAIVTPMSSSDWVHMIRVKNPEQASCRVNAAIDYVSGLLQTKGHTLMVSPAKCHDQGFREVTHPMMAMFMRPVVGVKGQWLIVASSSGAVNKCLDVAAGKAASILKNERFAREGLIPSGPIHSISFTDTSNFGQELGAAAGMVGMFGGMAVGAVKDQAPPEVAQLLQQLMAIVTKLGPVLQKLDFYSSEAHVATYDGALSYRCQSVVTYKSAGDSPDSAKTMTPDASVETAAARAKAKPGEAKAVAKDDERTKAADNSKPKR